MKYFLINLLFIALYSCQHNQIIVEEIDQPDKVKSAIVALERLNVIRENTIVSDSMLNADFKIFARLIHSTNNERNKSIDEVKTYLDSLNKLANRNKTNYNSNKYVTQINDQSFNNVYFSSIKDNKLVIKVCYFRDSIPDRYKNSRFGYPNAHIFFKSPFEYYLFDFSKNGDASIYKEYEFFQ